MYWHAVSAGFLGGLLGPLVGVGGGIIIVPILNSLGVPFQTAAAASLFSIVVTSLVSVYNSRKILDFSSLWKYAFFSTSAAVVSAFFAARYSGPWVYLAYGVYLMAIGAVLLKKTTPSRRRIWAGYLLISAGGLASSMFGIGGGTVYVPALILAAGMDAKAAVAYSMGLILPTAAFGTSTYLALGVLDLALGAAVAAGSFVGAYISSKYVMPRLKSDSVKRLFVTYVFLVGGYYLWRYFSLSFL